MKTNIKIVTGPGTYSSSELWDGELFSACVIYRDSKIITRIALNYEWVSDSPSNEISVCIDGKHNLSDAFCLTVLCQAGKAAAVLRNIIASAENNGKLKLQTHLKECLGIRE